MRSFRAAGGTDINRAMLEALSRAESGDSQSWARPTVIIFLTDGLPTEGVVETDLILNNVTQAAVTGRSRVGPRASTMPIEAGPGAK